MGNRFAHLIPNEQQPAAPQNNRFAHLIPAQPASAPVQAAQQQQEQQVTKSNSFVANLNALVPILGLPALLENTSKQSSTAGKFATGQMDAIHGGAQTLSKSLPFIAGPVNKLNNWIADNTGLTARLPEGGVDQQVRERESAYQARRKAAGESGFDGWRTSGGVASPVNIALARLGLGGSSLTAKAVGGGASGLLNAAFTPVTQGDYRSVKKNQAAIGAAFSAATPVITAGIGRIISPNASTNPQLQLLRKEGVRPTVGQTMGGGWNALEEKLQSVPVLGDMIAARRGKVLEQFNNAAINRVGQPINQKVSGFGAGAVKEMGDLASGAQEQAKNMIGNFQIDPQAGAKLAQLTQMVNQIPDKAAKKSAKDALELIKDQASKNGVMTADSFKSLSSRLTKEASTLSGASDAYQQKAGQAIAEMLTALEESALRQNPAAAQAMQQANAAWARNVIVEGASKAGANQGGRFTPAQLMGAVKGADKSVRDRATARGTALLQDLASAGNAIIGNKVPNSGTVDRLIPGIATLGGTAAISPTAAAALVGGAGMYTRPVQDLLTASIASRPQYAQAVRQALWKSSPAFAPITSSVGLGLLK